MHFYIDNVLATVTVPIQIQSIVSFYKKKLTYSHCLQVSVHYLGATNMMFVAGLMMAVAVEHCGLHHRYLLSG